MKTDRAGFRSKNPVFRILSQTVPKWPKNQRFWIFLKIGSKDSLDIMNMIRGHYCAHFAENRIFGKNPVLEIWPKKDRFFEKKYLFSMAHISVTSEAN